MVQDGLRPPFREPLQSAHVTESGTVLELDVQNLVPSEPSSFRLYDIDPEGCKDFSDFFCSTP